MRAERRPVVVAWHHHVLIASTDKGTCGVGVPEVVAVHDLQAITGADQFPRSADRLIVTMIVTLIRVAHVAFNYRRQRDADPDPRPKTSIAAIDVVRGRVSVVDHPINIENRPRIVRRATIAHTGGSMPDEDAGRGSCNLNGGPRPTHA